MSVPRITLISLIKIFFFSSRRRHTRLQGDWSSDVCSSDLIDAQLSKSFGLPNLKLIGENGKFEIRANFYNLFNKVNLNGTCGWNGIQCDIRQAHFGESGSALGSRVIEMQARFSF